MTFKATLIIGVMLAATVLNAVVEGQPQTSFNEGKGLCFIKQ